MPLPSDEKFAAVAPIVYTQRHIRPMAVRLLHDSERVPNPWGFFVRASNAVFETEGESR